MKKLLTLWGVIVLLSVFVSCHNGNARAVVATPTAGMELLETPEIPETPAAASAVHALSADLDGQVHVTLQWEPAEGAAYYIVSRAEQPGGAYIEIASLDGGAESYTDTFLDTGKTYSYRLRAGGSEAVYETVSVELPIYEGMFNTDGALYCYRDGKLVRDAEAEGLYFDANGQYTTGNTELDAYLRQLTAELTTPEMSQIEKFEALYRWVVDNCTYRTIEILPADSEDWEPAAALDMFERQSGNCFSYAAAVAMLGRNVGLQTRGVIGDCYQTYMWVYHGWTEVAYEGTLYVCDAEMEGVFAPNRDWEWDLFMKEYGTTPTEYDEY